MTTTRLESSNCVWALQEELPHMPGALCADKNPKIWDGKTEKTRNLAKEYCALCPARRDCLTWALEQEKRAPSYKRSCIWGGHTPTEREDIARYGRVRTREYKPQTVTTKPGNETITRPNGTTFEPRKRRIVYLPETRDNDARIMVTGLFDTEMAKRIIQQTIADGTSEIPVEVVQTALKSPPQTEWLHIYKTRSGESRAFKNSDYGAATVYYPIPGTRKDT